MNTLLWVCFCIGSLPLGKITQDAYGELSLQLFARDTD